MPSSNSTQEAKDEKYRRTTGTHPAHWGNIPDSPASATACYNPKFDVHRNRLAAGEKPPKDSPFAKDTYNYQQYKNKKKETSQDFRK